jgi:Cdc6-like AAA superfamily ATPase
MTGGVLLHGPPGCGKTSVVHEALGRLEVPVHWLCGFYNCIRPDHMFSKMWWNLSKEKCSGKIAERRLRHWYTSGNDKSAEVVVIDHVDLLADTAATRQILLWAGHPSSRLSIICVSARQAVAKSLRSLLSKTVSFPRYTHSQLQAIVLSGLENPELFHPAAVELAARKAAGPSLVGDARFAIGICERAAERAKEAGEETVGLRHITEAVKEMFDCRKAEAVMNCTVYEQEILRVLASQYLDGVEETALLPLYHKLTVQLRAKGLASLPLPATIAGLSRLCGRRLLIAKASRYTFGHSYRINIYVADIDKALATPSMRSVLWPGLEPPESLVLNSESDESIEEEEEDGVEGEGAGQSTGLAIPPSGGS